MPGQRRQDQARQHDHPAQGEQQPAPDPRPVRRRRVVPAGPPAFIHDPLLAKLVGDRVALPQIHEGMRLPAVGGGIEVLFRTKYGSFTIRA